jgi:hypothetical protein
MVSERAVVSVAAPVAVVGGPLLLGLLGVTRSARAGSGSSMRGFTWDWKLTIQSTLVCVCAFNLIFFVQELFLVLPKALTAGLRPTLFHNNHSWEGRNPLAKLFQGTGALATLAVAVSCAIWLKQRPPRSITTRLFVLWMIFHGCFEALPQFVIGAVLPQNDVGMAMEYFHLSQAAKAGTALIALCAIVAVAIALIGPFLELASSTEQVNSPRKRMRFIFRGVILPALLAIPLVIPFRIPGAIDQVVIAPVIMTVTGIVWMQAASWCVRAAPRGESLTPYSLVWVITALLVQLLAFQLVLRPGIHFF